MNISNIDIKIVDSWSEDEIVALYKAGGWWKETYNKSAIPSLIVGSFAFAVVIDLTIKKAVGMGRIISDGISDAYIQDVILLPEYRGRGIGKKLVKTLIDRCLSCGITWIALIAEPGNDNFYKDLGLEHMKGHTPMIYRYEG